MSISVWGFEGGPQETWASLAKESEDLRQWWGPQSGPPANTTGWWLVGDTGSTNEPVATSFTVLRRRLTQRNMLRLNDASFRFEKYDEHRMM